MKTLRFIHRATRWVWFYAALINTLVTPLAASYGGHPVAVAIAAIVPALAVGLLWGMAEADRRKLLGMQKGRAGEQIWNKTAFHGRPSPGAWDKLMAWIDNAADPLHNYDYDMTGQIAGDYHNGIVIRREASDEVVHVIQHT